MRASCTWRLIRGVWLACTASALPAQESAKPEAPPSAWSPAERAALLRHLFAAARDAGFPLAEVVARCGPEGDGTTTFAVVVEPGEREDDASAPLDFVVDAVTAAEDDAEHALRLVCLDMAFAADVAAATGHADVAGEAEAGIRGTRMRMVFTAGGGGGASEGMAGRALRAVRDALRAGDGAGQPLRSLRLHQPAGDGRAVPAELDFELVLRGSGFRRRCARFRQALQEAALASGSPFAPEAELWPPERLLAGRLGASYRWVVPLGRGR